MSGLELDGRSDEPLVGRLGTAPRRLGILAGAVPRPDEPGLFALEQGKQVETCLVVEVLGIGHVEAVAHDHSVRLCHEAFLLAVEGCHTIAVARHGSAGQCLGKGGVGLALGHNHLARIAGEAIGKLAQVAIVHTRSWRFPAQVSHIAVIDSKSHVGRIGGGVITHPGLNLGLGAGAGSIGRSDCKDAIAIGSIHIDPCCSSGCNSACSGLTAVDQDLVAQVTLELIAGGVAAWFLLKPAGSSHADEGLAVDSDSVVVPADDEIDCDVDYDDDAVPDSVAVADSAEYVWDDPAAAPADDKQAADEKPAEPLRWPMV